MTVVTAIRTHRLRAARRRLVQPGISTAMVNGSRIDVALRGWDRRVIAPSPAYGGPVSRLLLVGYVRATSRRIGLTAQALRSLDQL
jgi:hypothetical protein